ncbi:MAG: PspC domain-containing protein [Acidimicrobiia bacterium]
MRNEPGRTEDAGGAVATDTAPNQRPDVEQGRRLVRSRHDRVIAGVAGGLGEHFGVDPVVFRIGFVAFSLLGGSGLVLYGIGWLVVPEEGAKRSIADVLLRRWGHLVRRGAWPALAGILLLVTAAALLVHDAIHWGAGRVVLAVTLLTAGVALLAWNRTSRRLPPRSEAPVDAEAAEPPPGTGGLVGAEVPPSAPAPKAPPTAPAPPVSPRGPSELTRVTASLLLLIGGAAGLGDAAGLVDVTVEGVLAVALTVTGLGLVVGAWWGRSRALVVLGVGLTLLLAALTAFDVPLEGGFGERAYRPASTADLRDEYRLLGGEMLLDLSRVDIAEGTSRIEASVAFGTLTVITPRKHSVVVDAHVDAGELQVLGEHDQGLGNDARRVLRRAGSGRLRLDLRVGGGEIEVRRATP